VVSVTALRDAQGAIIGYLLIGTDNTARKQVEPSRTRLDQALQDAERRAARAPSWRPKGQPGEVGVPVQHEPRTALAAQRHPGLCAAHGIRHARAHAGQKRSIDQILQGRLVPAGADQRDPRPGADRVRQAVAVARAVSLAEVLPNARP
jgi:hypothetical protein